MQVRIERETGKIDLNAAEDPMLRALPLALGLDEDRAAALADAIQDWRDDNQLKRERGAEDRDYAAGRPGHSGGGPAVRQPGRAALPAVGRPLRGRCSLMSRSTQGAGHPEPARLPARLRAGDGDRRGLQ